MFSKPDPSKLIDDPRKLFHRDLEDATEGSHLNRLEDILICAEDIRVAFDC